MTRHHIIRPRRQREAELSARARAAWDRAHAGAARPPSRLNRIIVSLPAGARERMAAVARREELETGLRFSVSAWTRRTILQALEDAERISK